MRGADRKQTSKFGLGSFLLFSNGILLCNLLLPSTRYLMVRLLPALTIIFSNFSQKKILSSKPCTPLTRSTCRAYCIVYEIYCRHSIYIYICLLLKVVCRKPHIYRTTKRSMNGVKNSLTSELRQDEWSGVVNRSRMMGGGRSTGVRDGMNEHRVGKGKRVSTSKSLNGYPLVSDSIFIFIF